MHTVSYTVFQLKQQLCNHKSVSPTKCVYVLRTGTTIEWLTVNGLRVEGKSRVQRQTVHGHLPTLNAVPVVPQRGCAVELVVKTCPRAVVHTNQNIIQSPLGRVFPYNKGDKKWKWKRNQPINFFSNNMAVLCCVFLSQHTNLAVVATTGTLYRRSLLEVAAQWSLPGAPRRN